MPTCSRSRHAMRNMHGVGRIHTDLKCSPSCVHVQISVMCEGILEFFCHIATGEVLDY